MHPDTLVEAWSINFESNRPGFYAFNILAGLDKGVVFF